MNENKKREKVLVYTPRRRKNMFKNLIDDMNKSSGIEFLLDFLTILFFTIIGFLIFNWIIDVIL